jgi:hypothetical protein
MDIQEVFVQYRDRAAVEYGRLTTEIALLAAEKKAWLAISSEVLTLVQQTLAGPDDSYELALKQIEARLSG